MGPLWRWRENASGRSSLYWTVLFYDRRERITALAAKNRLPAVYPHNVFAEAGGLMSYGREPF